MRYLGLSIWSFLFFLNVNAQTDKAKIVIGIVVDQMRYDYIPKFWDDYSDDGFKKLVSNGAFCVNTNYDYKPTYTAPGHASIFTGTGPNHHGIVGNSWYSRKDSSQVYCVSEKNKDGSYFYSPKRLQSQTIGDMVRLSNGFKGKAFGVALKDRSAILPCGKSANAAYWFDGDSGKWISSDYYKGQNESLMDSFNQRQNINQYINHDWNLSLPIENYAESIEDKNDYEGNLTKNGKNYFPYSIQGAFKEVGYDILKTIPQGNQMTADFAIALIDEEKLGEDEFLDFLSISFSATDYIGHRFGVNSKEIQDCYIKLDQTIASMIKSFDSKFGKENYLLFLTSDHGAVENPNYLKHHNIEAGFIDDKLLKKGLENALQQKFGGENWILKFTNMNIYFNLETVNKSSYSKSEIYSFTKAYCENQSGIFQAFAPEFDQANNQIEQICMRGYHPKNSGELILIEEPNWIDYSKTGSTHGSPYNYDTHVPLIFYGTQIRAQKVNESVYVKDIAPTICTILSLSFPNLTTGKAIEKVCK